MRPLPGRNRSCAHHRPHPRQNPRWHPAAAGACQAPVHRSSFPPRDVLETKTQQQGGRSVTIQRIAPISLPEPPAALAPLNIKDPALQQRIAEVREDQPRHELLVIGATVLHSQDSPPRTHVCHWSGGRGRFVNFWSSADFGLLSGFSSFVGSDGTEYSLIMMWSPVEIDRLSDWSGERHPESAAPKIPELPGDKAVFEITSGEPTSESLAAIRALHEIYNNDYDRLKTAHEGRETARVQREAELKANPPQPKNIVLNYWRTETKTPAAGKGAAR